jgi:hypothetical protein
LGRLNGRNQPDGQLVDKRSKNQKMLANFQRNFAGVISRVKQQVNNSECGGGFLKFPTQFTMAKDGEIGIGTSRAIRRG